MTSSKKNNLFKLDLKYIKIGNGTESALAFHGFGQDNGHYSPFETIYGEKYTMYCFNLPFHGDDTTSKTGTPATKEIVKEFFQDFLERNKITGFTIIGFSIGAKMALTLLELYPEKVQNLVLIAPDGFRINFWYRLGTGSAITRSAFKYFINHPEYFFRFSDSMASLGLVHPGVIRFAKSQMNTLEKREKVFYTWMFFRKLHLRKNRIVKLLIDHKIPVSVFLGKEDKIILEKELRFLEAIDTINSNITVLNAGHNDLIKETANYLKSTTDK